MGDANFYYLTTAKNELGVVYAESTAGMGTWSDQANPRMVVGLCNEACNMFRGHMENLAVSDVKYILV